MKFQLHNSRWSTFSYLVTMKTQCFCHKKSGTSQSNFSAPSSSFCNQVWRQKGYVAAFQRQREIELERGDMTTTSKRIRHQELTSSFSFNWISVRGGLQRCRHSNCKHSFRFVWSLSGRKAKLRLGMLLFVSCLMCFVALSVVVCAGFCNFMG